MTQKPVLRGEVDARALRVLVRSRVGGLGKRSKCNALRCWRSQFLSTAKWYSCIVLGTKFEKAPLALKQNKSAWRPEAHPPCRSRMQDMKSDPGRPHIVFPCVQIGRSRQWLLGPRQYWVDGSVGIEATPWCLPGRKCHKF